MYTITRQIQWPEGHKVVEISEGGIDYTNPDALVPRYPHEFETVSSPIEAVEFAIEICRAWRKDGDKDAKIGIGATGGMTFPFDTCTFNDARKWAKETDEKLERCPTCGKIVEDLREWDLAGFYTNDGEFFPYDDGYKYCSERCAEKASEFEPEEDEEE